MGPHYSCEIFTVRRCSSASLQPIYRNDALCKHIFNPDRYFKGMIFFHFIIKLLVTLTDPVIGCFKIYVDVIPGKY